MRYTVSYGWPPKLTASWQSHKVILFLFQARELEISLPRALKIKLVKNLIPLATSPTADFLTFCADSGNIPYLTMVAQSEITPILTLTILPAFEDPQNYREGLSHLLKKKNQREGEEKKKEGMGVNTKGN